MAAESDVPTPEQEAFAILEKIAKQSRHVFDDVKRGNVATAIVQAGSEADKYVSTHFPDIEIIRIP